MSIFNYQTRVELYETDACGVIFYSHLFHFVHRAFSAFLKENNITIQERLEKQDYFFPVVHAEGDYLAPIVTDDLLDIQLEVLNIGTSSFKLGYTLFKKETCVAKAQVVHVAIDRNKSKIELPESLRVLLGQFVSDKVNVI